MATKVLQVLGDVAADAWIAKDLSVLPTPWFVRMDVYIPSATITTWDNLASNSGSLLMLGDTDIPTEDQDESIFLVAEGFSFSSSPTRWNSFIPPLFYVPGVDPPVDAWCTIDFSFDGETAIWKIDGATIRTETVSSGEISPAPTGVIYVGALNAPLIAGTVLYMGNVKVGSAPGGIDFFCDDFEDGDLSKWDVTTGPVSVVTSPVGDAPSGPCAPAVLSTVYPLKHKWRWVVGRLFHPSGSAGTGGGIVTFLDNLATNQKVTFTLDAPAVAEGDVPADNPEINIPAGDGDPFVSYNNRVLYGFRREEGNPPWVCRFTGILQILEDEATSDEPVSHYTAYDPWGWLKTVPVVNPDGSLVGGQGLTYRGKTGNYIARDLLTNALAVMVAAFPQQPIFIDETGGTIETTAVIDKIVFAQGTMVGDAWTQLCDTDTIDIVLTPVYDPLVRPGILADLNIYNQAGVQRPNAIFAWDLFPRSLVGISRLLDGTGMVNTAQFFTEGRAATPAVDAASRTKYGGYWMEAAYSGRSTLAAISLLAAAQVALWKKGKTTVTIDPAPELSPDPFLDYYLGDRVPVYAGRKTAGGGRSFRALLDAGAAGSGGKWEAPQRVVQIPIDLADDQVETITQMLLST